MGMDRRRFLASSAAIVSLEACVRESGPPLVETSYGRIRGSQGNGVYRFLGVPYGVDTAGANRFLPPRPPESWTGVRDATQAGHKAPQTPATRPSPRPNAPAHSIFSSFRSDAPESEDCLILNVWTPGLDEARRPVMVWLHGGGFSSGAGLQPPTEGSNLSRLGDVVVVSINHRLGALGYLYLAGFGGRFAQAANQGQLDQILALQWVRDNITNFGGDPGNVTIFGQSGGGAKVSVLQSMPAAHGLFHKAICQSGSYLASATPEIGDAAARALMAQLDLRDGDLDALQRVPAGQLIDAMNAVIGQGMALGFEPIREGEQLPYRPYAPEALELSRDVPLMIGSTQSEATSTLQDAEVFDLAWDDLPRKWLGWANGPGREPQITPAQVAQQIAQFRAAYPLEGAGELYVRMVSDLHFIFNAITIAERKSAADGAPVWLYEVDYRTKVDNGQWGSPHSMDLPLVFANTDAAPSMITNEPEAQATSAAMLRAWTNFARHGDPNGAGLPNVPEYDMTTSPVYLFNSSPTMETDYRVEDRRILAGMPTSHS